MTAFSLVDEQQRFRETYCFHLQSLRSEYCIFLKAVEFYEQFSDYCLIEKCMLYEVITCVVILAIYTLRTQC
jgi:hypothetical protein